MYTNQPLSSKSETEAVLKRDVWDHFVHDSDLAFVNVYEYYLGEGHKEAEDNEYAKVVGELFSDAVSVGAIVLPSFSEAEDFVFSLAPRGILGHQNILKVEFKDEYKALKEFEYVYYTTGVDKTMSAGALEVSLSYMADAVTKLLAKERRAGANQIAARRPA